MPSVVCRLSARAQNPSTEWLARGGAGFVLRSNRCKTCPTRARVRPRTIRRPQCGACRAAECAQFHARAAFLPVEADRWPGRKHAALPSLSAVQSLLFGRPHSLRKSKSRKASVEMEDLQIGQARRLL